ncbi:MAG: ATP-binding protein [Chlorobi bacterium]|nr:ATP-binding protein [Chlorobiota bacterium]
MKKVVITGPESSGKSTLTKELAGFYGALFFPEYARIYVENLNRKYTYADVEYIAERQIKTLSGNYYGKTENYVFFDTGLIITKLWFEIVFKKVPDYLLEAIENIKIDCYLLCSPDLPWIPDNVRENGGEERMILFEKYKSELENYGFKYFIIKGKGSERLSCATRYLSSAYCL